MTNYEHILEQYPENVPVAVAAKLLGKPVAWVQHGLRSRALPFGSCVEFERASFHISPRALIRYLEGDVMVPARELMDAIAAETAKATVAALKKEVS